MEPCNVCKEEIVNRKDFISCYGFCNNNFHFSCLKNGNENYKNPLLGYLDKIPNLQWFCNDCVQYTIDGVHVSVLRLVQQIACKAIDVQHVTPTIKHSMQTEKSADSDSQLPPIATKISNELPISNLNQIPTEINSNENTNQTTNDDVTEEMETQSIDTDNATNVASISNSNIDNSIFSNSVFHRNYTSKSAHKRSRSCSPSEISNVNKKSCDSSEVQSISSAQKSSLSDFVIDRNAKSNQKINDKVIRSLYLSPFSPETDPTKIINHLNSFDFINKFSGDIKCIKLVKKKRNEKSHSFVSFKLEIPDEFFELVADSNIWPIGVTVKEFVVKNPNPVGLKVGFKPSNEQKNGNVFQPRNRPKPQNQPKRSHYHFQTQSQYPTPTNFRRSSQTAHQTMTQISAPLQTRLRKNPFARNQNQNQTRQINQQQMYR